MWPVNTGDRWITAAAALELATGAGLIAAPSLVARLLFGAELTAPGQATGRFAGFVLLSLAAACWPRGATTSASLPALQALLLLSVLAAGYLLYLGIDGQLVGIVLWPIAAIHLAFVIGLARTSITNRPPQPES